MLHRSGYDHLYHHHRQSGAFSPITNIAVITGVILFYLAWIMPEAFRRFLNRNYRPAVIQTLSEEEVLKQLDELSA